MRLETSRLLLYKACWKLAQGQDAKLDIALSKLSISEAVIQSSLDAVHLHGALGIKTSAGIERMLRDALPATILSGTTEMMSYLIAMELGL